MIQKNITQVNKALTIFQRNIDLAPDSVFHAQQKADNHKLCHLNYFWDP